MRSAGLSALLCAWTLVVLAGPVRAAEPVPFTAAGDFSEAAVMRGVIATKAQCDAVANAVWASTREDGQACIKYWSAGFPVKANGRAIVFFHGDIFAGRPGTHGSSGNHMQRRRAAESALLSAALDQIKQRLHIRELVIAGQSGGGHVTASLLTRRHDIVCAVPTSSPSSPRIRWTMKGLNKDTTGYRDSYEPAEHLDKSHMHAALRVFVLGNPDDRNVPWASQTFLHDRLRTIGVPTVLLKGRGSGPDLHGLPNSARAVAGWCHHDQTTEEVVRRARRGLQG